MAAIHNAEALFQEMKQRGVTPSSVTYILLMTAWAKENRPERIETLLKELTQHYQTSKSDRTRPNDKAYTTCLQAWARAGDPERTITILNEWISACDSGLVKNKPKTQEFTAVLLAWVRSGRPDAAKKAELGLQQMLKLAETNTFQCFPDVYSFTLAIRAYAESNQEKAGERAWLLVNKMEQLSKLYPSQSLEPDLLTYHNLIKALIRSCQKRNHEHAVIAEDRLHHLLAELQKKTGSFWTTNRSEVILRSVQDEIARCSFRNKAALLDQSKRLNAHAVFVAKRGEQEKW